MAGEWVETTLGDMVDFLSGGTPSKARAEYWGGSIPWVSAKDMKRFRLEDSEDHVTEDGAAASTKMVPAGTVLLLVRGMTLLNDVPICIAGQEMTFNQDVKALRPKPGVLSEFLPYLLLGHKERLLSSVDLAGHGTGRLNSDELKGLDVYLPPLHEQHAIAEILGTLDDKIELNRRMAETLEGMARALFKSWFVDFDPVRAKQEGRDPGLPAELAALFPDRLVESALGEIPDGWGVGGFGDVAELIGEKESPLDDPETVFDHYSIPAYDAGKTPIIEVGGGIKSPKTRVPPGAVLLSKLNPEIERVWYVSVRPADRAVCSTEFLALLPREPLGRTYLYCLVRSRGFRDLLKGLVTGTSKSHQRVQLPSLLGLEVARPTSSLLSRFEEAAGPLLSEMARRHQESTTLAALRNALLKPLLTGDVRTQHADASATP